MQDTKGFNPFKFGIVGGSDSHNTGVPYRQDNFFGGHAHLDGTIETRMSGHLFAGLDVRLENPAGVTGLWAEENTRESLLDAMQRKETFGTTSNGQSRGPGREHRSVDKATGARQATAGQWAEFRPLQGLRTRHRGAAPRRPHQERQFPGVNTSLALAAPPHDASPVFEEHRAWDSD